MSRWRVGRSVPINVYDDTDSPVCQCRTPEQASRIVKAINDSEALEIAVEALRQYRSIENWRRLEYMAGPFALWDRAGSRNGPHLADEALMKIFQIQHVSTAEQVEAPSAGGGGASKL